MKSAGQVWKRDWMCWEEKWICRMEEKVMKRGSFGDRMMIVMIEILRDNGVM